MMNLSSAEAVRVLGPMSAVMGGFGGRLGARCAVAGRLVGVSTDMIPGANTPLTVRECVPVHPQMEQLPPMWLIRAWPQSTHIDIPFRPIVGRYAGRVIRSRAWDGAAAESERSSGSPMGEFTGHLVRIGADVAAIAEPVSWKGRFSEHDFESLIVANPSLAGEELLVLGRQLKEFQEDDKRLDVLAVDRNGEIVLIELKVDEDFGVTDLQALAYAAAYANKTGEHFVATLVGWMKRNGTPDATVEGAKKTLTEFLGLDDFSDWEPSQHVRIKLIAPNFPRRVLATVKWLGDLYGMRIEAIRARLFDAGADLQCSFERVLPLPGAEEFDLTVREREKRKRDENTARRPDVINFLIAKGILANGDVLWIAPSALPEDVRDRWAADDPLFKFQLVAGDPRNPKFMWHPEPDNEQTLSPSTAPYHVSKALCPDRDFRLYRSVHEKFTVEPQGKTVGELAEEHGWTSGTEDS